MWKFELLGEYGGGGTMELASSSLIYRGWVLTRSKSCARLRKTPVDPSRSNMNIWREATSSASLVIPAGQLLEVAMEKCPSSPRRSFCWLRVWNCCQSGA